MTGRPRPPAAFGEALRAAVLGSETTRVWLFDQDIRARWVPPNALSLWGWTVDDVIGRSVHQLFGEREGALIEPLLRRGLVETTEEDVGETPDERRRMTAFPITVDGRPHVGVASIMISGWAQAAMHGFELRQEMVTDTAQVGLWRRDLTTDELTRNEWLDRMLGTAPGQPMLATDWAAIVHPDDIVQAQEVVTAGIASGEVFETVYRVCRPNGDQRLLQTRGQRSPEDPNVLIGVVLDLTPGVHATAEELALQRLALAATESERLRFSSDLHDGPVQDITAASIYLSLMNDRLGRPGGDAEAARMARRSSEILFRATTELRRILDDLYTLDEDVDVESFVDEITGLAGELTEQHGVEVTASFDFGGRDSFRVGLLSITHRVVVEAMRNAAEHAGASSVSVRVTIAGDWITAVIEDDGVGFDPTGEHGPDAAGLTLMDRRCRSTGGTLTVQTGVDAGTSVTVRLPTTLPGMPRRRQS